METTQEISLWYASQYDCLDTTQRYSADAKLLYTSTTVPIPERVREKLPLYDHPEYPDSYKNLTHIKALNCGRQYNRGVLAYRIEGDKCTPQSLQFSFPLNLAPRKQ